MLKQGVQHSVTLPAQSVDPQWGVSHHRPPLMAAATVAFNAAAVGVGAGSFVVVTASSARADAYHPIHVKYTATA
jgi:hypothetical protein